MSLSGCYILINILHRSSTTLYTCHNGLFSKLNSVSMKHACIICILMSLRHGPLLWMWCMRYEAKHCYFKRLAGIMCALELLQRVTMEISCITSNMHHTTIYMKTPWNSWKFQAFCHELCMNEHMNLSTKSPGISCKIS